MTCSECEPLRAALDELRTSAHANHRVDAEGNCNWGSCARARTILAAAPSRDAVAPWREALTEFVEAAESIEVWYETGDKAIRRLAVKPLMGALFDARALLDGAP